MFIAYHKIYFCFFVVLKIGLALQHDGTNSKLNTIADLADSYHFSRPSTGDFTVSFYMKVNCATIPFGAGGEIAFTIIDFSLFLENFRSALYYQEMVTWPLVDKTFRIHCIVMLGMLGAGKFLT